eukprot:TRINITY_DN97541_c0_g1_i1.p1 TRINITY_DN97541_c0_g1~~TRINITY_DN97541_c0_g1_i1.p1  ORF type:complete len:221 (-),score=54.43 TRINITY_DN97541_c0_g1_i1:137-799(-)
MGCGVSRRPQSCTTITNIPGCEWTQQMSAQIKATVTVVDTWLKDKDGAKAYKCFQEQVFGCDCDTAVAAISEETAAAAGTMGAVMGGLFGMLAQSESGMAAGSDFGAMMGAMLGGVGAGLQVKEIFDHVEVLFGLPRADAKQLALKKVAEKTLKEELTINQQTGEVSLQVLQKRYFTGNDLDNAFREWTRDSAQRASVGDRTVFLEFGLMCLSIEILRQA